MATSKRMTYEIRRTFDAPLDFAYRWCTDYQADDAQRAHERYVRKVLSRRRDRVVYEDLEEASTGWTWRRTTVQLRPPDHWHAESNGNMRHFSIDYWLRALPDGRTEFRFRGTRTSTPHGGPNPSKREMERSLQLLWRNLGASLARDYRAYSGPRRPLRTRRG